MKNTIKTIIWVSVFAMAMAFLESAVVVYLREIYYPEGFKFPLTLIDDHIIVTEILREAATIIMLICIGYFASKKVASRFAYFLYSFAIWDIFYYIYLKLILDWPSTIFEWDVLFLIPVTWVGPVISPVILALSMIILSLVIIFHDKENLPVKISKIEWSLLIIGSIVAIVSFCWDYSTFVLEHYTVKELWTFAPADNLLELSKTYIPKNFNWGLFWIGELLILSGIFILWNRLRKIK